MCSANADVRFWSKAGLMQCSKACTLWANSGHAYFSPLLCHDHQKNIGTCPLLAISQSFLQGERSFTAFASQEYASRADLSRGPNDRGRELRFCGDKCRWTHHNNKKVRLKT
jgi:hypothetical protein